MSAVADQKNQRAIICFSSVGMTQSAARMAVEVITPSVAMFSFTAATILVRWLCTGGCDKKLLPTVVAAEVELLSIAFGVESGCFVNGHPADGVFGHGIRFIHWLCPFSCLLADFTCLS
jgi:hypothetical protein